MAVIISGYSVLNRSMLKFLDIKNKQTQRFPFCIIFLTTYLKDSKNCPVTIQIAQSCFLFASLCSLQISAKLDQFPEIPLSAHETARNPGATSTRYISFPTLSEEPTFVMEILMAMNINASSSSETLFRACTRFRGRQSRRLQTTEPFDTFYRISFDPPSPLPIYGPCFSPSSWLWRDSWIFQRRLPFRSSVAAPLLPLSFTAGYSDVVASFASQSFPVCRASPRCLESFRGEMWNVTRCPMRATRLCRVGRLGIMKTQGWKPAPVRNETPCLGCVCRLEFLFADTRPNRCPNDTGRE